MRGPAEAQSKPVVRTSERNIGECELIFSSRQGQRIEARRSGNQHRVAVTEKAILFLDRQFVSAPNSLVAAKRADQHQ